MVRNNKTISLLTPVKILSCAAAVGKKEANGPLKDSFDIIYMDTTLGQKSFEKAEAMLQARALERAMNKIGAKNSDVDLVFCGDLLNQCISSSYGLKSFEIPFFGLYGACSTMAQALAMSALMCECDSAKLCAAVTSSHFCSAERQYRFPLNYGGQRTPTSQWTVTGAGAALVSKSELNLPQIKAVTFGKICDLGVRDINNMGAAMAPVSVKLRPYPMRN